MEVFWGERELPQCLISLLDLKAAAVTRLPTPPPPQPNWSPPHRHGRGSWPLSCPVRTAACDSEGLSSQPGQTLLCFWSLEDFQVLATTGPLLGIFTHVYFGLSHHLMISAISGTDVSTIWPQFMIKSVTSCSPSCSGWVLWGVPETFNSTVTHQTETLQTID